jgi:hypothetical protein
MPTDIANAIPAKTNPERRHAGGALMRSLKETWRRPIAKFKVVQSVTVEANNPKQAAEEASRVI